MSDDELAEHLRFEAIRLHDNTRGTANEIYVGGILNVAAYAINANRLESLAEYIGAWIKAEKERVTQ